MPKYKYKVTEMEKRAFQVSVMADTPADAELALKDYAERGVKLSSLTLGPIMTTTDIKLEAL